MKLPHNNQFGTGRAMAWLREQVGHQGENCLIWPFAVDRDGYGMLVHERRKYKAHRWMCEAIHGAPPEPDHHAAHECGNGHRGCVNPRHLVWKTPAQNALDRLKHGTANSGTGRRARKLTVEQVQEILALKGKKKDVELAAIYNVSHSCIRKIQQGISWAGGKPGKNGFKPGDPRNIGWARMHANRRARAASVVGEG